MESPQGTFFACGDQATQWGAKCSSTRHRDIAREKDGCLDLSRTLLRCCCLLRVSPSFAVPPLASKPKESCATSMLFQEAHAIFGILAVVVPNKTLQLPQQEPLVGIRVEG